MGTSVSKLTDNMDGSFSEGSVPSVPIKTPQIRRLDLDPRSPSLDIARTPIEVLKTPITRSTVATANSPSTIEDLDVSTTHYDPRSPTTEFHRTPIVVDATLKLRSIHNKNLDNARAALVVVTPAKPSKISEKVCRKIYGTTEINSEKQISPKLLESSPITPRPLENKRNSIVGLLETNIDFVETDLDVVIQSKMLSKLATSMNSSSSDVELAQPLGSSDVEIAEPIVNDSLNSTHTDTEPDSETEGDLGTIESADQFDVAQNLISIVEEANKISEAVEAKNILSVDELDKKLTNLIYEDKQSEVSPKINKPITGHRTPLGDRNSNSQQRKCIPILKVSDKPTKPPVAISKIPVFKEKRLKGKGNVQCENTPPRIKTKQSQWSAEDSLII